MTVDEMIEAFERINEKQSWRAFDDFLNAGRVPSKRRDLSAFLILDRLVPSGGDIVAAAEHDQIWLDPSLEDLAAVITEDDIELLAACGVWIDDRTDSLSMFA